jgi:hypothetical protein
MDLSCISVPSATTSVFDRILTIDWYDGFTSGAVYRAVDTLAFRFDLIVWGPGQNMRVFALSRIPTSGFEKVIQLWSQLELPQQPFWNIPWQQMVDDLSGWNHKLDAILADAGSPEVAIETDALFKTLIGARAITAFAPALPERFEAYRSLDNYEEWHRYLGAAS